VAKEREKAFLEIARNRNFLTEEQYRELCETVQTLANLSVSKKVTDICLEKGYLNRSLINEVIREVNITQGYPRIGGFEVIEKIGQGGMGMVLKARQVSMDRIVALKILPPRLAANKSFIRRFEREAKAAARINYQGVVTAYDTGVEKELRWIAMEYVEGISLREKLQAQGRLDENEALDITLQAARALVHINRAGLVHRDIKPDNILLTLGGRVKIADLGLARGDILADITITQTGSAVGTPHYISPEQARGVPDIDIRADIYSLGATLYHMLIGAVPFEGSTPAVVLTKHINEPLPDPAALRPELKPQIIKILRKMMAKDRENRFQAPDELIVALDGNFAQAGLSVSTGTTSPKATTVHRTAPAKPKAPPLNLKKLVIITGAVFAGVLVLLGLYAALSGKGAHNESPDGPQTNAAQGEITVGANALQSNKRKGKKKNITVSQSADADYKNLASAFRAVEAGAHIRIRDNGRYTITADDKLIAASPFTILSNSNRRATIVVKARKTGSLLKVPGGTNFKDVIITFENDAALAAPQGSISLQNVDFGPSRNQLVIHAGGGRTRIDNCLFSRPRDSAIEFHGTGKSETVEITNAFIDGGVFPFNTGGETESLLKVSITNTAFAEITASQKNLKGAKYTFGMNLFNPIQSGQITRDWREAFRKIMGGESKAKHFFTRTSASFGNRTLGDYTVIKGTSPAHPGTDIDLSDMNIGLKNPTGRLKGPAREKPTERRYRDFPGRRPLRDSSRLRKDRERPRK